MTAKASAFQTGQKIRAPPFVVDSTMRMPLEHISRPTAALRLLIPHPTSPLRVFGPKTA